MAFQELYLTIARLVYLFEITPEKPEELENNFEILDHFSEFALAHDFPSSSWKYSHASQQMSRSRVPFALSNFEKEELCPPHILKLELYLQTLW